MNTKKWLLIFPLLILSLVAGCQYLPFQKAAEAPLPSTAAVKRGNLEVSVIASGNITLPQVIQLGFSGAVSGSQAGNAIVEELNVSLGARVTKDQVIARLDTSAQERDLLGLRNNLEAANLALEKAAEPLYKPEEIAKGEVAISSAKANLQSAQVALTKAQVPFTDNDFANADAAVYNADAAVRSAASALQKAKNDLDTTVKQNQVNIQDATNTLTTLQNQFEGGGGGGGKGAALTTVTEYDVQKAVDALTLAQRKADSDLASAQITLTKAQDALSAAQATYNDAVFKKNDMLSKKNGDPVDLAQKQAAVVNAQTAVVTAEQTLSLMKQPPDPVDIKIRKNAVAAAQLAVDNAQSQLAKSTIIAPFDGVIGDFKAKVGDAIQPATFFIPLVDTTQARVDALVAEYDAMKVKLGMPTVITVDALPGVPFNGSVDAISPLSTNQQGIVQYATKIKLQSRNTGSQGSSQPGSPGPSRQAPGGGAAGATSSGTQNIELKDGLTATANIIVDSKDGVLLVPNRALIFQSGQQQVQVLVNGQIQDRVVKTGLANEQFTEITDGVSEGDQVVLQAAAGAAGAAGIPRGAGFRIPGG